MLKVLGRATSINVRKVLWTCDELGLAFENEDWGAPTLPLRDPAFVALNPNALIPVLVDGDFVLWQSNTICRYLAVRERRFDLLPEGARERARVEQWVDWQATELNETWGPAFLGLVRKSPDHADPAAIARSAGRWNARMRVLDQQLERTGAWVAGDGFTLADIVLGLSFHRWRSTPIERPALPGVESWGRRLAERPAFRVHASDATP